jgi:hypothetical protein
MQPGTGATGHKQLLQMSFRTGIERERELVLCEDFADFLSEFFTPAS